MNDYSRSRLPNWPILFGFGLLLFVMLSACSPASAEVKPPEIIYGRDMCGACGMIISEPRFAAASVLEDGKSIKFDDLGEMILYHRNKPDLKVRAMFVHDYDTAAWVRSEHAFYVKSMDLQSPMGFGTAAFAEKSSAESFAQRFNTQVVTLAELKVEPPMKSGGHGHK